MTPNLWLTILPMLLQCWGILLTLAAFGLVILQLRAVQRNSTMASFLSAVTEHSILIEEHGMKIRSGEMKVNLRGLQPKLEDLLTSRYESNLEAMAEDYLLGDNGLVVHAGKKALFESIAREFAMQDHLFNLYEEEFIAGKHLRLVSKELWDYWDFYMRGNFKDPVVQRHWKLRKELAEGFPAFTAFVEKEYMLPAPASPPRALVQENESDAAP